MVSTNGKILHGTNRGLKLRTRQIGGYVSDETVRKGLQEMMSIRIRSGFEDNETGGISRTMRSDQDGIYEEKGLIDEDQDGAHQFLVDHGIIKGPARPRRGA